VHADIFDSGESQESDPVADPTYATHLSMNIWDFAGQIQYHSMHQTFFRPNCLYVLVLDLQMDDCGARISTENAMLQDAHKWLNSIVSCAGPDIGLVIVGTHGDSIENANTRLDSLVFLLMEIVSDVECDKVLCSAKKAIVDNKTGTGIKQLKKLLHDEAKLVLDQLENVPLRWLRLLDFLLDDFLPDSNSFCAPIDLVKKAAKTIGILKSEELTEALLYFDHIGDVIYFGEEQLKDWVFTQPQLLLNAMKPLVLPTGPTVLTRKERKELAEDGVLQNDALSKLWSSHDFQNQQQIRSVLSSSGLIMDFGKRIVVPSRLQNHSISVPLLHNEIEFSVRTQVSSHLPPYLFAYLLARLQELSLVSESCACLYLRMDTLPVGVTLTSYRLVFIEEKLSHTISFVLRGSTQRPMPESRLALVDRAKQLVVCVHQLVHEKYNWMSLKSFVGPVGGDSWCILATSPECPDCSKLELLTEHITKVGIKLSLEDLISTASQSEYSQAESERFFQPVCSIDAVETLIAMEPPTQRADQEIYCQSLVDTEKVLVEWLADLSRLEVEKNYKPTEEQILWIRRIARFYHVFVPCLKLKYFNHPVRPFTVFVSHAGEDKDAYASPFARYLEQNNVRTFLDRRSLRPGAHPHDDMFHAAITSNYMWCVLSVDFAKKFYPMRELMIGYTRYIQEDRKHFCLILDCFEKQDERGPWMRRILKEIQSLRIYDKDGTNVPFPTMCRGKEGEDFAERYCRLAGLTLGDGKVLVKSHQRENVWASWFSCSGCSFFHLLRSICPDRGSTSEG
jgi:Ras of Complex, Roc, domain of DAPkinase/C-terminal of Roc, COR, domain/TIR domain